MSRLLASSLLLTALATACTERPHPSAPVDDAELAVVTTRTGTVRFLADDSGGVAVMEISDHALGPAERLLEREGATPLEVFLAVAPSDAAIPEALVAHHAELRGDVVPRALAAEVSGVTVDGFPSCTSAAWPGWHAGTTAAYTDRASDFVSTAGDISHKSYINDQFARRFDACGGNNVSSQSPITVQIRRKTNAGVWQNVGLWEPIFASRRFYFTSLGGSYPDWQMHLTRPSSGTNRSFGVGGAWNPAFGFGD